MVTPFLATPLHGPLAAPSLASNARTVVKLLLATPLPPTALIAPSLASNHESYITPAPLQMLLTTISAIVSHDAYLFYDALLFTDNQTRMVGLPQAQGSRCPPLPSQCSREQESDVLPIKILLK